MSRWRWTLLIFELFLFALILVLPQVDLPDFTFHGGTAPIVAKARLSVPILPTVRIPVLIRPVIAVAHWAGDSQNSRLAPDTHSLLSLFCTLIC
jgi:hypothetical protein